MNIRAITTIAGPTATMNMRDAWSGEWIIVYICVKIAPPNPAYPFIHDPGIDLWSRGVVEIALNSTPYSFPPLQLGQAHVTHAGHAEVRIMFRQRFFTDNVPALVRGFHAAPQGEERLEEGPQIYRPLLCSGHSL